MELSSGNDVEKHEENQQDSRTLICQYVAHSSYFVCLCPLASAAMPSWACIIFKYETVLIFSVCSVPNPWFITCSIHIQCFLEVILGYRLEMTCF